MRKRKKKKRKMFRVSKQPGRYSSKSTFSDNKQSQQQKPQDNTSRSNGSNFRRNTQGDPPQRRPQRQFRESCDYCTGPKHARGECPASDKPCYNCGSFGHFAAKCVGPPRHRPVRQLHSDNEQCKYGGSDVESQFAYRVTALNSVDCHTETDNFPMLVDGNKLGFCLDTGSHGDIITVEDFRKMSPRPELRPSGQRFRAFGNTATFQSQGCFKGSIKVSPTSTGIDSTIHVVDLPGKACNLLSGKSCKKLGLITFNLPRDVNALSVPNVTDLVNKFADIFGHIGRHKYTKVSLPIDPEVQPVACPPSRLPFHLLPAIEAELDRLQNEGVIEDVPVDCNNQWVNRMVPVPRKMPDGKTGVRLTIDWRNVNKGLRAVHHEIPSVEDLFYDLNGAVIFSDLDMNDAFSQLPLDDESKKITTFSTPRGLKRLTCLVQGAKPSSAIFHETLRRALQGIKNQLNIADNIIVWGTGATEEEAKLSHYETLRQVFEVFRRNGLTLHKNKSKFETKSIKFFGFVFTKDGRSPDPEKVRSYKEAGIPETKEEALSWLGMVGFNKGFVPGFATLTEPIRRVCQECRLPFWPRTEKGI